MRVFRCALLTTVLLGGVGGWLGLLWLERACAGTAFTLVEDGLFVGSYVAKPPPGTKAVVNLCGQKDRFQVEASLWEPILEGGKEPTVAWLSRVVDFIAAQRRAGRTTYVHCLAGLNRCGMVTTAYLMQEHGWGRDKALAFLRSKRPQIQPNPTLMRLLAQWEKALKEKREAGSK
jgi:hypothetical protein